MHVVMKAKNMIAIESSFFNLSRSELIILDLNPGLKRIFLFIKLLCFPTLELSYNIRGRRATEIKVNTR